jgi:hypothetical protein
MNEVEIILEAFGTKVVEDLRKSLSEKLQARAASYKSKYPGGSSNPGDSALSASIKYLIVDSSEGIKLNVYLNSYWEAVDSGRKAAGVSQSARIDKWIKSRNLMPGFITNNLKDRLKRQAENTSNRKKKVLKKMKFADAVKAMDFLVRRKLKNKGYQGNQFLSSVLEDGRQEKLATDIRLAMKKDIEIVLKTNRYGDNNT